MKRFTIRLKREYKLIALALILLFIGLGFVIYLSEDQSRVVANQPKTIDEVAADFANGKKEGAIKTAESMLLKNPEDEALKNKLAAFYFQAGLYEKFLEFISKHNLSGGAIFNMAAKVYQAKSDTDKVREYYQKAIEADKDVAQYYLNYSAYFQSLGEYQAAFDCIKSGIVSNSRSASLLISAASLSIKLNDKKQAKSYASTALEVDPENAQAKAILESI